MMFESLLQAPAFESLLSLPILFGQAEPIVNSAPSVNSAPVVAGTWMYLTIAMGGLGVFLCTQGLGQSRGGRTLAAIGCLIVLGALGLDAALLPISIERFLVLAFGWLAVYGAIGFISFRQPVHAALGFAMSVLSACGLYMMLSAPFLAAATTIIYAGATIIIFLFVLMFASTKHLQPFEVKLSTPWLGVMAATAVLGLLMAALQQMPIEAPAEGVTLASTASVGDLGVSLFTKYLWTVELAGTLLLVATVGAIMIAQRDPLHGRVTHEGAQQS